MQKKAASRSSSQSTTSPVPSAAPETRAAAWRAGTAAILSFVIPGLGQLYKGQPRWGIVWCAVVVAGYMWDQQYGAAVHGACLLDAFLKK